MGTLLSLRSSAVAGDAVHTGHHDVHEHQVELVLLKQVNGLLAGVSTGDAVAFAGEVYFQSGYDVVIIAANENLIHEKSPFPCSVLS